MTSVVPLLEGKRIVICAGSGGVGKTTTSAALAMGMAATGMKVAVVTIDPAKRLANALGMDELGNEPHLVDPARFAPHGVVVRLGRADEHARAGRLGHRAHEVVTTRHGDLEEYEF